MIREEIIISKNAEELSRNFVSILEKLTSTYPHINIALSGGNTPKTIFDYMATHCATSIEWNRVSFFWGDERCVIPDDVMSNYGMTRKHLFSKIDAISGASIYRINGENEPEEEANWYNKVLNKKLATRNGFPVFEIVLLGLGDDGHTVSIFPNQIELWDSEKACVVAEHPESGMKRVSITGGVVNNAQYVFFMVTGKNKAEKVRDIIGNRAQLADIYPAAKVDPKNGYLYWLLDEEAASLL